MAEKILLNYDHIIDYNNTAENAVGATTSTTLRTIPTPAGDIAYVRKFGTPYLITDVTDIEDPVDVNMTFKVYANDGTLLGSRVGGGAFVDGSTVTAQGCYMVIEADGGNVTVLTGIDVDTDIDAGGITFVCAAETVSDGTTLTLYLSDTGSTYYDSNLKYGGARHTPALNGTRTPYFDISTAEAACADANDDGVEVLDSATYDEELTLNLSQFSLYCTDGQAPTITRGIGARISREVTTQYNNTTTVYFNKAGDDANSGTWQSPFLTLNAAMTQAATDNVHCVFGGSGALYDSFFEENLVLNSADTVNLEADYGYTPTIRTSTQAGISTNGGYVLSVYGFQLDGQNTSEFLISNIDGASLTVNDSTLVNTDYGVYYGTADIDTVEVNRNIFSSFSVTCVYLKDIGAASTVNITKNIFRESGTGLWFDSDTTTVALDFTNNIMHSFNTGASKGAWLRGNQTINGDFSNNTINGAATGVDFEAAYTPALSIDNNIITNCSTGVSADAANTIDYTFFYGNTTDYNVNITSNDDTTTDLKYIDESNNNFAINVDSPAWKADGSENDGGASLKTILISASTIEINGFYIDGQDQYNNAILKTGATDYTALTLKSCSIYDYNGISIDDYSGSDTDSVYEDLLIKDNGVGIKWTYGGNTITSSIIYNSKSYGLHIDYTVQTINHCVFYNNHYGLYFESNSGGIIIKNSIFDLNGLYGIYSEIAVSITYCCLVDAVNSNVTTSSTTNITDNPLFVDLESGSEDFNIKTIEAGKIKDSACKDASDKTAFPDIGAYDMARSVNTDNWKKYTFAFNPQVEWTNIIQGYSTFNDAVGSSDNFGKDTKRQFVFDFGARNQVSSEEIRQKMEYFSTMVKMRVNEIVNEKTKFRLHLQPTSYLVAKSTGTITASSKNISDTLKDWIENQWKGYHVGIQWDSGTNMVIDSVAKTGSIAGGWTVDEWVGYFSYINGYYYYIKSNTVNTLTFADPDETLVSGLSDWNIEKYFKIISNTSNALCVSDDDGELPTGSYTYYIDFIECKCFNPKFKYSQPIYLQDREHSKTGYTIIFEEV